MCGWVIKRLGKVWRGGRGIKIEGWYVNSRYHGEGERLNGYALRKLGIHHTSTDSRKPKERQKAKLNKPDCGRKTTSFNLFPLHTNSNSLPPSNITSLQFTVQVFFPSAVARLLHTSSINLLTATTFPTTSTSCCSNSSLRKACWLG